MEEEKLTSLKGLFIKYQFENYRIVREEAIRNKDCIVQELYRRLKTSIEMLDEAETEKEVRQIYKQFIEH